MREGNGSDRPNAISIFFVYGRRIIYEIMQNQENAWVCLAWKDIRVNTVKRQRKMKKRI